MTKLIANSGPLRIPGSREIVPQTSVGENKRLIVTGKVV
jgi:hypothetical protein